MFNKTVILLDTKAMAKIQGEPVKAAAAAPIKGRAAGKLIVHRKSGSMVEAVSLPVKKVMAAADIAGLRTKKTQRISGRVSPELVKQAKEHTGLQSDTELVEFALANLALEDNFAKTFRAVRGTVDPDLELGF